MLSNELKEKLESLGFSNKEVQVYLLLLEKSPLAVSALAKESKLKRTTVYDVVASLMEKGIVHEVEQGRLKQYSAKDPKVLLELERTKMKGLEEAMPKLQAMFQHHSFQPKIEYLDGVEAMKNSQLRLLDSKSGYYRYMGSAQSFFDLHEKAFWEEYVKRRIEKHVWSYGIRFKNKELDVDFFKSGQEWLREVRFLPMNTLETITSYTICDDTVHIHSTPEENYGMVIHSEEFSKMMDIQWELLWGISMKEI